MEIEAPPRVEDIVDLQGWLQKLWLKIQDDHLKGSATWNPGSIADGAEEAKEVTVSGAVLGDMAIASFSLDVTDLVLDAQVTATDKVTCILANNTGGAIDLAEGTVYCRVFKRVA
jgi:hypothetical protein